MAQPGGSLPPGMLRPVADVAVVLLAIAGLAARHDGSYSPGTTFSERAPGDANGSDGPNRRRATSKGHESAPRNVRRTLIVAIPTTMETEAPSLRSYQHMLPRDGRGRDKQVASLMSGWHRLKP